MSTLPSSEPEPDVPTEPAVAAEGAAPPPPAAGEAQPPAPPAPPARESDALKKLRRADFLFGKTIGEGAYARVVHARLKPEKARAAAAPPSSPPPSRRRALRLARRARAPRPLARQKCAIGDTFAIKIMDKAHITKHGKVKYVMMEKTLLSRLSHPHIVKLWFSFQARRRGREIARERSRARVRGAGRAPREERARSRGSRAAGPRPLVHGDGARARRRAAQDD